MKLAGRLPTLKQLERKGKDAGAVLDAIESQLEEVLAFSTGSLSHQRPRALAKLRRLQKRREEFFSEDDDSTAND